MTASRVPFAVPPELPLPEPLLQEVLAAYGEPQRAYHGVSHLVDVLARFAPRGDPPGHLPAPRIRHS